MELLLQMSEVQKHMPSFPYCLPKGLTHKLTAALTV